MALFADPTPEESTKQTLKSAVVGGRNHLLATWQNCYAYVWANPHGLTPAEVLAVIGTDAVELFTFSYQAGELLNAAGAGLVNAPPEGVTYTANQDGSITLTS